MQQQHSSAIGHQQQFVVGHQTTTPESQQLVRLNSPIVQVSGISPPMATEDQRQQNPQQKAHYMQVKISNNQNI